MNNATPTLCPACGESAQWEAAGELIHDYGGYEPGMNELIAAQGPNTLIWGCFGCDSWGLRAGVTFAEEQTGRRPRCLTCGLMTERHIPTTLRDELRTLGDDASYQHLDEIEAALGHDGLIDFCSHCWAANRSPWFWPATT